MMQGLGLIDCDRAMLSMNSRVDIHHIFHHARERADLWSNLISLSPLVHGLDSRHAVELRICCLWIKLGKQEFDLEELNRAAGATRPGALPVLAWLEAHKSSRPRVEELRLKLIKRVRSAQ